MEKVTAVLISFLRPGYTKACVQSLRKQYPGINIIVAENGEYKESMQDFCNQHNAKYVRMPFDSGVCYARNRLVEMVRTPYTLVGDDDFFYTETAMVDSMLSFLEEKTEYDLIGGRVSLAGMVQNYQGYITRNHDHFITEKIDLDTTDYEVFNNLRYCKADLVFNFFLARTDKIRKVKWDEEIKVAYEHYSWFVDFKEAGGQVAFSPDPVVIHKPDHVDPEQHDTYKIYRNRQSDKERFFSRFGIQYHVGMNGLKTYKPGHVVEAKRESLKHVDFCITTFMRPNSLKRLLHSIAKYYPNANVYIADQSMHFDRQFYKDLRYEVFNMGLVKRISVDQLPYDCGLSYARNYLVRKTPNKYKLILDDDFIFTSKTEIGKMVKLLDDFPEAGVVGGLVTQHGHEVHYEFNIDLNTEKKTIYHLQDPMRWKEHKGIRFRKLECVLNFALIRKEVFNAVLWDENLKVSEHLDFFVRLKKMTRFQVFYTPDSVIDHLNDESKGLYKELRQRNDFLVYMLKKHGMNRVKYLNGQVFELSTDGGIKHYKETPE